MRENMIEEEKNQFAVLIDADNISPKYAPIIFQELEAYGFPSCRRIYGNWSKANGWNEELLLEYSIIPVQQFSYTSGKNATDMAMVIDAMDLLYGKKVDGFCIVTSDSDFTRLAMRLREEHMYVIGMGESKSIIFITPIPPTKREIPAINAIAIGVERNTNRMLRLINQILDFRKIQNKKMKICAK